MNRGFFSIGVYHPKRENNIGGLWRAAYIYEASFIFTVGCRYGRRQASDTPNTPKHTPLFHFHDMDDLLEHLPNSTPLIGVELDEAAVSLTDFKHLERCAYLLGAEDHGIPSSVLDRCHSVVQIPTPLPVSHNVATAGSLILHDRFLKNAKSDGSQV